MNEVNGFSGWKCPECGRVFAPHIDECKYCGGENAAPEPPSPYIPHPYPHTRPYRDPYDPFKWKPWWQYPLITTTISTTGTAPLPTVLY